MGKCLTEINYVGEKYLDKNVKAIIAEMFKNYVKMVCVFKYYVAYVLTTKFCISIAMIYEHEWYCGNLLHPHKLTAFVFN